MEVVRSQYCRLSCSPRTPVLSSGGVLRTEVISSKLSGSIHSRERFPRSSRNWRTFASEDPNRESFLDRSLARSLIIAGSCGTLGILLGQYLNIDPFGNLHWNVFDFLIGLEFALPPVLLTYMVFKFNEKEDSDSASMILKKTKSENLEVLSTIVDDEKRDPWSEFQDALDMIRKGKVAQFGALRRPLPFILLERIVRWLPAEMLSGVVGLTASGNWFRDRFSEAGLDGYLLASGLDPAAMGKWTSLVCFATISISIILTKAQSAQRSARSSSIQRTVEEVQNAMQKRSQTTIPSEFLERFLWKADAQAEVVAVIESVISIIRRICQSSAFVVTGNLGSSLVVAGAPFLLETLWTEEGYNKWTTKAAKLRESMDSLVIKVMSTPRYKDAKIRFRREIENYEQRTNSADEIEDKVGDSWSNEDKSEQGGGGEIIMDLPYLSMCFDVVLKDLRRVQNSPLLSQEDSECVQREKLEVEDLVNRAQKLIEENEDLTPPKPELNYFRPMKDRYKGTKKDE